MTPADHVSLMEERLQRLNDEKTWSQSHTKMVLAHNHASITFWLLAMASLCFALLNGYHGYTSSGGAVAGVAAIIIAFLYFTIELTVPVSAHLMSWGAKGQSRWLVRMIGLVAYILGVVFSLLILQGKFSSGADSASARDEAKASVYATDKTQLTQVTKTIAELTQRVGASSPESVLAEMKVLLAQPMSRKATLSDTTEECQGLRKTAKERTLCGQYDKLRKLREDAISLQMAKVELSKLTGNLMDVSRTSVKSSDVQDRVISSILGIKLENIQLFKASFIAIMAALLTHLLWAAYGMTINASIATNREELFERNALQRALGREVVAKQRVAEDTATEFLVAKGATPKVARAVVNAPIREQPAAVQIQSYFNERAIMGDDFTMQVGAFHDDYSSWAKNSGVTVVRVDRFVAIVKDIGLHISSDGRIVGAALRSA